LSALEREVMETQHLTAEIAENGGELVATSTKSTKAGAVQVEFSLPTIP
jgi:hypothetical protein